MKTYKKVMEELKEYPELKKKGVAFAASKSPAGRWKYWMILWYGNAEDAAKVYHWLKHRGWEYVVVHNCGKFQIQISGRGISPPSVKIV